MIKARIGGTALNYDGKTDITATSRGNYTMGRIVVGRANGWTEKDFTADIIPPVVCLCLMIAGFVLLIKKVHIVSAFFNVLPATVMIFFFRYRLSDEFTIDSVYPKYYWRHFAPLLLVVVLSVWLVVIAVRANLKFKNQYTRVTENLYNLYKVKVGNGEEVSEDQWDLFLQKYDPFSYKPQFLENIKKEENSEGKSDT